MSKHRKVLGRISLKFDYVKNMSTTFVYLYWLLLGVVLYHSDFKIIPFIKFTISSWNTQWYIDIVHHTSATIILICIIKSIEVLG